GLERGLRLLDRGHRLLRPRDVLAFLEHAARSAGGGRGAPERPDADPLPAEERVQDRGPHRDRRLEALLGGLLPLAGLGLLRAPQALDERGLPGRVLLAERLQPRVAVAPRLLSQPDAEIPLALAGPRQGPRAGVALELEWL